MSKNDAKFFKKKASFLSVYKYNKKNRNSNFLLKTNPEKHFHKTRLFLYVIKHMLYMDEQTLFSCKKYTENKLKVVILPSFV
ncbi:hypothetical protein D0T49_06050 [Paludibacter sp. 221]|nr:hypothetical protein [Paludibacter sp. 221]